MWKAILAGTTALIIAGSSLVYAQQRSGRPDGMQRGPNIEGMRALADARLAALRAGLALTPEQEQNWAAFEQAAREMQNLRLQRLNAFMAQRRDPQAASADPAERLRRRGAAMAEAGVALQKLADAAEPLYKSLDDNQKRRFAALGRMGGGRDGRDVRDSRDRDFRSGRDDGGRDFRDRRDGRDRDFRGGGRDFGGRDFRDFRGGPDFRGFRGGRDDDRRDFRGRGRDFRDRDFRGGDRDFRGGRDDDRRDYRGRDFRGDRDGGDFRGGRDDDRHDFRGRDDDRRSFRDRDGRDFRGRGDDGPRGPGRWFGGPDDRSE
jgi:LTXXQ motif family protein